MPRVNNAQCTLYRVKVFMFLWYICIGFVDISPNSDRTSIDGILNFTPPQPFETFVSSTCNFFMWLQHIFFAMSEANVGCYLQVCFLC